MSAQKPPQKRELKDTAAPAPASSLSVGSYHALIIGIKDYHPPLPRLDTPVNDATALAKLLQEQYGFTEVKLLPNATRSQILLALNDFKHNLPENSNLLIYYAGHGHKDPGTGIAYWLPVDAQPDNDINWIGASAITDELQGIHSSHVLVISDSCYSGDLGEQRGFDISPAERDTYLRRMLESPSRNLMSSGGDEPVSDGGREGHSVFAYALIQSLRTIPEDGFTAHDLFYKYLQQWVAGKSNQVPQYGSIKHSGHEFGDFVFSRGGKGVPVAPVPSPSPGPPGVPSDVPATVSPEAERYAINQVVNAYADSYNRKDAAALWKIWPGAPQKTKQDIRNSFNSALSIIMKVTDGNIELVGAHATVSGQFAQEYTPRNESLRKLSGPITFELSKVSGAWVIDSIK